MTKNSYRQIFKSTSIVGGAQVATLAVKVIQVKVLAILLGPSGVGLAGMYTSAVSMIQAVSGLGIAQAGVRQIAQATSTGDDDKVAATVKTLKGTAIGSGLAGALIVVLFREQLSRATFGTTEYATEIGVISITLLLIGISQGQMALLQGMRRIGDLAKCNVLGAVFGAIGSITLVYFLREDGIVAYIVAGAAFAITTSWYYARRIQISDIRIGWESFATEAKGLVGLGFGFMLGGLFTSLSDYMIRAIAVREFDLVAVGLYTAAMTLSSLYIGIVLQAMGADFLPRLTAVAADNTAVNRLVNEQTEIGILMALPGVLGTLLFAPWVMSAFYSEEFSQASQIIRWQVLGVCLRVIIWPMGFIQVAKGRSGIFIGTQLLASALHVGLAWISIQLWGLEGLGIAFFLLYIAHALVILGVARYLSRFFWTRSSAKVLALSAIATTAVFVSTSIPKYGLGIGIVITLISIIIALIQIKNLLAIDLPTSIGALRDRINKR